MRSKRLLVLFITYCVFLITLSLIGTLASPSSVLAEGSPWDPPIEDDTVVDTLTINGTSGNPSPLETILWVISTL